MPGLNGIFNALTGNQPRESTRDQARRILRGLFGHEIMTAEKKPGGYLRISGQTDPIFYGTETENTVLVQSGEKSGSYYCVNEGYSGPKELPMKIKVGFVCKDGGEMPLITIFVKHEKKTGPEISFCDLQQLGLNDPENQMQRMLLLKTTGRLMKRVEEGENIDPHLLRQHLIDKVGIKPKMWTVHDSVLNNYPGGISAHPELRSAERLKRLHARSHSAPHK